MSRSCKVFLSRIFLIPEEIFDIKSASSQNLLEISMQKLSTTIDRKKLPPCNHLDIGALRLPTLARHQPITCLIPSYGRQPQRTDVQVVAGGDFFVSMIEHLS